MIRVVFKNLRKSDLAKAAVLERLRPFITKFPELRSGLIQVTLEMQNSPEQPGPDLFTVKSHVYGGRYHGLRIEKSAPTLYMAMNILVDHLLEKLNRFSDRIRVRQRHNARKTIAFL